MNHREGEMHRDVRAKIEMWKTIRERDNSRIPPKWLLQQEYENRKPEVTEDGSIHPDVLATIEAWDRKTGRTSCPTPPTVYLEEPSKDVRALPREDGSIHPDVLSTMERWDRRTGGSSRANSTGPLSEEHREEIGKSVRRAARENKYGL
jgi:hypothetical protein